MSICIQATSEMVGGECKQLQVEEIAVSDNKMDPKTLSIKALKIYTYIPIKGNKVWMLWQRATNWH